MPFPARVYDYLGAACVAVAFCSLFVGRVLNYQLTTVEGTFLERVAAKAEVWDLAHRWLLVGAVALIPAALALRRSFYRKTPRLADVAAAIVVFGGALTVGQLALDYAMLAAAQSDPPSQQTIDLLRAMPIVDWAFYKLPNFAMLANILFAFAIWKQGPSWRLQAALVVLGVVALAVGRMLGPIGERVALGIATLGYLSVAWKMAAGNEQADASNAQDV
jgi:hypothetical protein